MGDTGLVKEPDKTEESADDYVAQWEARLKWKYLITATEEYVVFIDQEGDLDWETSSLFNPGTRDDERKHNSILNDAALLETSPCDGFSDKTRIHFRRLIGEAMVRSFDGDYSNARNMLSAAHEYYRARSEEASRDWYLRGSFAATIPFAITGLVFWVWRTNVQTYFGADFLWGVLSCTMGAIGALLSVIWRSGHLKFDCSAGKPLHYLEAFSRICAGAISGVLVALAIKYQLILSVLSGGTRVYGVMMIAALAGGSGERLASSIISKFEASNVSMHRVEHEGR